MTSSTELTFFQQRLILSIFPAGTRIVTARAVREWLLPCPIRVRVELPSGMAEEVMLRRDRHPGGVEYEAAVYPVLHDLGLRVPRLLAGPVLDPAEMHLGAMTLLSVLPGHDLLVWGYSLPPEHQTALAEHILDAIIELHEVTGQVQQSSLQQILPSYTLAAELEAIGKHVTFSHLDTSYHRAHEFLQVNLNQAQLPLVFSNGDYNPANFLFDGHTRTGFIDFTWSCFADPLFGVTKYATYTWLPYDRQYLIQRYVERCAFSVSAMQFRVAMACIWRAEQLPDEERGFLNELLSSTLIALV